MKAPRLGCEKPAGENDKLEFVDFTVQEIATIISLSPVLRQEYTL